MPITFGAFKPQHFFTWIVTGLCLLAAIAYVWEPIDISTVQGAGTAGTAAENERLLFSILMLLAAGASAGWFAYAFTGDPARRRDEEVKFSYFFVIASFAIVTLPPFVKTQAIGSEPIGIISGCVHNAQAEQLRCPSAADEQAAPKGGAERAVAGPGAVRPASVDADARNQWLVNIGGALTPQNPEKCRSPANALCKPGSPDNRAVVTGGLVVPLPFVIIALFGGAISLSRRVPEIQKRSEQDYVGTPEEPALKMWEAREQLAFQILQFLSAPLIAIAAHQIVEPESQASAVALAFLAGFGSETILLMIRGIANGIQPKSMTLASTASVASTSVATEGEVVPGVDGTGGGANVAASSIGRTKVPALETASATIRLWIDVDSLDPGSVALTVNGAATGVTAEGLAELMLEVGREYRLEASGRRGGQAVRGELVLTVTVDDEGSPREIALV